MSDKLMACPFCGGSDIRIHDHGNIGTGMFHRGQRVYTLGCYNCGANTGGGMYEEHGRKMLIERWNTRAVLALAAPAVALPTGFLAAKAMQDREYEKGFIAGQREMRAVMLAAPAVPETPIDDKEHPRFFAGYIAGMKDARLSDDIAAPAVQPPVDNAFVAPGCEQFPAVPEPTSSQKLADAGHTRRPTWHALPAEDETAAQPQGEPQSADAVDAKVLRWEKSGYQEYLCYDPDGKVHGTVKQETLSHRWNANLRNQHKWVGEFMTEAQAKAAIVAALSQSAAAAKEGS